MNVGGTAGSSSSAPLPMGEERIISAVHIILSSPKHLGHIIEKSHIAAEDVTSVKENILRNIALLDEDVKEFTHALTRSGVQDAEKLYRALKEEVDCFESHSYSEATQSVMTLAWLVKDVAADQQDIDHLDIYSNYYQQYFFSTDGKAIKRTSAPKKPDNITIEIDIAGFYQSRDRLYYQYDRNKRAHQNAGNKMQKRICFYFKRPEEGASETECADFILRQGKFLKELADQVSENAFMGTKFPNARNNISYLEDGILYLGADHEKDIDKEIEKLITKAQNLMKKYALEPEQSIACRQKRLADGMSTGLDGQPYSQMSFGRITDVIVRDIIHNQGVIPEMYSEYQDDLSGYNIRAELLKRFGAAEASFKVFLARSKEVSHPAQDSDARRCLEVFLKDVNEMIRYCQKFSVPKQLMTGLNKQVVKVMHIFKSNLGIINHSYYSGHSVVDRLINIKKCFEIIDQMQNDAS